MIFDDEVPLPAHPSLELRTTGLWADLVVAEPGERVSLSVEAFALAVDDATVPAQALRGDLVPFGVELDWEGARPAEAEGRGEGIEGYELLCEVSGALIVGEETFDISAPGRRAHRWGALQVERGVTLSPPSSDRPADG